MVGEVGSTERRVIVATCLYVRSNLRGEPTGHDWWHAKRVRRLATAIAMKEGADRYIVTLASLLHDMADFKFTGSEDAGPRVAEEFLRSQGVRRQVVCSVCDIIAHMSFKGAGVPEAHLSREGECVQDADRLDAIGAIGIARTFAYGGFVRRPIHDPELAPARHETADMYRQTVGTTINHFHEKLLLLEGRLKTGTGRTLALRRHGFLLEFLTRFEEEWSGSDVAADLAGAGAAGRE